MGEMRPNKAPIEMSTDAAAMSAPIKFCSDNLIFESGKDLIFSKKLGIYDVG